jgi:hypothetical protein
MFRIPNIGHYNHYDFISVTNNNQCLGTIVFNNAARKNCRHNDAIEDEFRTMFGNADLKPETY